MMDSINIKIKLAGVGALIILLLSIPYIMIFIYNIPIWILTDLLIMIAVISIVIYIIKSKHPEIIYSKKNRIIFTILAAIMGIYFLSYPIMDLLEGAPLNLQSLSNMVLGIAFLVSSFGFAFSKYKNICALLFIIIGGSAIFLKIWLLDANGFPKIFINALSLTWILLWISCIILFTWVYIIKFRKSKKI